MLNFFLKDDECKKLTDKDLIYQRIIALLSIFNFELIFIHEKLYTTIKIFLFQIFKSLN